MLKHTAHVLHVKERVDDIKFRLIRKSDVLLQCSMTCYNLFLF